MMILPMSESANGQANGQAKPKTVPKPPTKTKQQTLIGFGKAATGKTKSASPAIGNDTPNGVQKSPEILVPSTPEPEETQVVESASGETQATETLVEDDSQQVTGDSGAPNDVSFVLRSNTRM